MSDEMKTKTLEDVQAENEKLKEQVEDLKVAAAKKLADAKAPKNKAFT